MKSEVVKREPLFSVFPVDPLYIIWDREKETHTFCMFIILSGREVGFRSNVLSCMSRASSLVVFSPVLDPTTGPESDSSNRQSFVDDQTLCRVPNFEE